MQKWFTPDGGEVHYIGGSEALPSPLKPAQERELVSVLHEGDPQVRATLIEHNLRLVEMCIRDRAQGKRIEPRGV